MISQINFCFVLGWIVLGTAMLLFSALMAMFPKKLPTSKSKVGVLKNGDIITLETVKQTEKPEFVNNAISQEKLVNEAEKETLPTWKGIVQKMNYLFNKTTIILVNLTIHNIIINYEGS